jgi:protein-S-isoprenylcysteine O-methyltransferase Ste14
MKRASAAIGSIAFLIVAPGTLAGLVPYGLTGWVMGPGPLPLQALGGLLIAAGLALLLECFGRFVVVGGGTPAPLAPPERLVVTGAYRRVRNPMYVAVTAIILGQAALLGDLRLVGYAALIWTAFHLWVLAYEEPALRRSFPQDFAGYAAAVPRWLPRLTPWRG